MVPHRSRSAALLLAVLLAATSTARAGAPDRYEELRRAQDYIGAFAQAVSELDPSLPTTAADTLNLLDGLNRITAVAFEAGDHDTARLACGAAIELGREAAPAPGIPRRLGGAYVWSGLLARRLHGPAAAAAELALADSILATVPDAHREIGRLLQARANVRRSARGSAASLGLYEDALAYRRAHLPSPDPDVADNLVWLAWNLNEAHRPADAARVFAEAEHELRALGMEHHILMGTILENRFDAAALQGDLAACRRLATAESEIYEKARPGFPFGYARGGACPPNGYQRLLWVCLQEGRWDEAFRAWDRERSRVTREFFRLSRWLDGPGASHRTRLRMLHRAMNRAVSLVPTETSPPQRLTAVLRALHSWAELQLLIRGFEPEFERRDVDPAALRAHLPPGTAIVGSTGFEIGGKSAEYRTLRRMDRWALVLRPDEPLRWVASPPLVGRELEDALARDLAIRHTMERVAAWPTRLGPDPELDAALRYQAEAVYGPMVPHLEGIDTVVSIGTSLSIIADYCPGFPANMATIPSAGIFLDLLREGSGMPGLRHPLLVGDDGAGTVQLLPSTGLELAALERLLPGAVVLSGPDASEERLRDLDRTGRLRGFDVIHLASHARISSIQRHSALVLADHDPARPGRGLLMAGELLYDLDLKPDLVVLSGCSTATTGVRMFGENQSLAQVLLGKGARHVVASRWEVDDRAAALIMERFYGNLTGKGPGAPDGRPMPCAAALGEASRWLRDMENAQGVKPYAHPLYWAGFLVYGLP